VPRRDNANIFKTNFQNHVVTGFKQLTPDEKGYEVFNVQIRSNSSGKEKIYNFGIQKSTTD
jgi:hypothetical protein